MKLSEFINLARGVNDGDNLPKEILVGLYEGVVKTPLAMH